MEKDPSMPNSARRFVCIRFRFQSGIISPESQVLFPNKYGVYFESLRSGIISNSSFLKSLSRFEQGTSST